LEALPELIVTPALVFAPPPELCTMTAEDAPALNVAVASAVVPLVPIATAQDAHGAAARRIPRAQVVSLFIISARLRGDTPQNPIRERRDCHAA
jgi:hypothetical protein